MHLFDQRRHVNTLVPVPEGYCLCRGNDLERECTQRFPCPGHFQSQPDRLEGIAECGFLGCHRNTGNEQPSKVDVRAVRQSDRTARRAAQGLPAQKPGKTISTGMYRHSEDTSGVGSWLSCPCPSCIWHCLQRHGECILATQRFASQNNYTSVARIRIGRC